MDRWTVFRRVRIVLFSILIFMCLGLGGLLLVMLVRGWSTFSTFQRAFLTSLVGLYAFTAILLYLMIVVIFRLWLDIARTVTLVLFHVASAVIFLFYAMRSSCGKFACNTMDLVFLIGSCAISGLFVIYLLYVSVMACLPRPVESLTGKAELGLPPTPKSEGLGYEDNRKRSPSSATSETGLLETGSLSDDRASVLGLPRYGALRVVNGDAGYLPAALAPASWQQGAYHRGVPASLPTPRSPSSVSQASIRPDTQMRVGQVGQTPRTSPFPNHSHYSVPRYDTPGSVMTMSSNASSTPFITGEPEQRTKAFSNYYMGGTAGYITPPENGFESSTSWDHIGQPPQYIPRILSPGYLPPSLTPRQTSLNHARSYTMPFAVPDPYHTYPSPMPGRPSAYLNVSRIPHVITPRSLTPGRQSVHSVTPSLDFHPAGRRTPTPSRPSPALGGYPQRPLSASLVFRSTNPLTSSGPAPTKAPLVRLGPGPVSSIRRYATVQDSHAESAPRFKPALPLSRR